MSEKRILEVQGQARVRAEQAQDFFHDLELWERNISQKDDQLKRAHVVSQKVGIYQANLLINCDEILDS